MAVLSQAPITFLLIVVNLLVSLYALYMNRAVFDRFAFSPVRAVRDKEYFRFLSGAFLHASPAHLMFNMITLYFFGPYLEIRLQPVTYVIVYFGSLLGAHVVTYWFHRSNESYRAVGASGAVTGVIFSFCLFEPRAGIGLLFIPVMIPAYLFAILFVVLSIFALRGSGQQERGGIAHEAHLGGGFVGVVLTILLEPGVIATFLSNFGL